MMSLIPYSVTICRATFGEREGVAERATPRDHADLVHRVGVRQHVRGQSVATLVIRDHALLALAHDARLAFGTGHNAIDRFLDLLRPDHPLAPARGEECRLVDDVRQIGAGEPWRALGDHVEVDALLEWLAPGVHAEDPLATLEVRTVDRH